MRQELAEIHDLSTAEIFELLFDPIYDEICVVNIESRELLLNGLDLAVQQLFFLFC